jgi:phenylacetate-coenzyme A ligase PaaK-like adenylate-forming protein
MIFNERIGTIPSDKLRTLQDKRLRQNDIELSMKIAIVKTGAIPRSEGGKLSRIIDLRKI